MESPHARPQPANGDALLLRGSANFVNLKSCRRFIDGFLSRTNARDERRITAERAQLQPPRTHGTWDYEDTSAVVIAFTYLVKLRA
jgi:hypothetical protein